MTQISQLITDDPRTPLQKLRRPQLQRLAKANGIKFDPKGPATSLRLQLEGAGIDGTKSNLFRTIQVQDENGFTTESLDPIVKPHATEGKDINYDAIIEANAKANEKEEENNDLKQQIEALTAMVEKLTKTETSKEDILHELTPPDPPVKILNTAFYSNMKMHEIRALCKEKDITTSPTDKKVDLIEKLNGQNTP